VLSGMTFDNLWERPESGFPIGWPQDWDGNAQDLKMQRIELGAMFHRVILNNLTLSQNASWNLDGSNQVQVVPPSTRIEFWVMDDSAMSFYQPNGQVIELTFVELVKEDISFVFDDGEWTRFLGSQLDGDCEDAFATLVNQFLSAPLRPGASAANTQSVVDAFFDFSRGLDLWSRNSLFSDDPYWTGPRERLDGARAEMLNAAFRLE